MRAGCTGTAFVFSGRPDPEWPVPDEARRRLEAIWTTLKPAASGPPPAPALGYRGCAIRCDAGREWLAYSGIVSCRSGSGDVDHRSDPRRTFEHLLLSTAPAGMVPPSLVP